MKKLGGTGTRVGMTSPQILMFMQRVDLHDATEWHHGDCFGFDEQSHVFAKERGFWVVVHPPINDEYRAFCKGDVILPPKEYLHRDKDIAQSISYGFACPQQKKEQKRGSGTWATVRYFRQYKVPHEIIYPDGTYKVFMPE